MRAVAVVLLILVELLEQVAPVVVVLVVLVLALSLEPRILVVVAVVHLKETLLYLAAPASSSSRSINKDIHAKQGLSILWHQYGNGASSSRC
jgi:hypothetical protein